MKRREAFQQVAFLSLGLIGTGSVFGCSKTPNCTDVTGLTPAEIQTRNETAKYVEQTPDPSKKCAGCTFYVAGQPGPCGACNVVKGPINPEGYCVLYAAKPAAG